MNSKKFGGLGEDKGSVYEAGPTKTGVVPLKITQIGNSLGVILPKELLAKLNVDKGDVLFATGGPGGLNLTGYDPDLAEELELGNAFMKRYRDTFKALAK